MGGVRVKSHIEKREKGVSGSENSTCKGPEAGKYLVPLRTEEETGGIDMGGNS